MYTTKKNSPPLTIRAAREQLPQLVRRAAQGTSVFPIGPRGKPTAVLLGLRAYEALQASRLQEGGWDKLRGELVGTEEELMADLQRGRQRVRAGK